MDRDTLEASLRGFLKDDLMIDMDEVQADTELVSTGIIDSADLVRVATHLEREAGIEVPDQDISADHFDSIAKILDYCEAKLR